MREVFSMFQRLYPACIWVSVVGVDNTPSQALMQALGFVNDGNIKRDVF